MAIYTGIQVLSARVRKRKIQTPQAWGHSCLNQNLYGACTRFLLWWGAHRQEQTRVPGDSPKSDEGTGRKASLGKVCCRDTHWCISAMHAGDVGREVCKACWGKMGSHLQKVPGDKGVIVCKVCQGHRCTPAKCARDTGRSEKCQHLQVHN